MTGTAVQRTRRHRQPEEKASCRRVRLNAGLGHIALRLTARGCPRKQIGEGHRRAIVNPHQLTPALHEVFKKLALKFKCQLNRLP